MGKSTHQQTNFIGGEWVETATGRADDVRYRASLAKMRNAMPTEQGAYQRRAGTQAIIPTRNKNYAKLIAFEVAGQSLPYIMEFTDSSLRFFFDTSPVFADEAFITAVPGINSDGLNFTTNRATSWELGEDIMLWFPPDYYPLSDEAGYRGRVLKLVNGTAATNLTVGDAEGNTSVLLSSPTWHDSLQAWKIFRLATSITGASVLSKLRGIQTKQSVIVVQASIPPQEVKMTSAPSGFTDPVFSIAAVPFVDGPYGALKGVGGSVSSLTGSTTFTPASGAFVASDVGRHIRLFSEPLAWVIGTTYAYGDLVKYNNGYWQSLSASNTGHYPGSPLTSGGSTTTYWAPAPNAARWVWGAISSRTGSTATFTLTDASATGGASGTIPTLNGTSSITDYQLGLYNSTDGYPICGCFHEGRLVLSGPTGGRWDASMSGTLYQFSITDQFGTVNDNNSISYTVNSAEQFYWMRSDDRGIIMGGLHGESLTSSSTGDDTLTPTAAKTRGITEYKCAQIDPVKAGSSLIFAQRYGRHVYEYLIDSLSARFGGKPLNDFAPHLTKSTVQELAYTEEPIPTIWCRNADGTLASCTYRRISRFLSEAPIFNAWHLQTIADDRKVESLCGSASGGGADLCASLTQDSYTAPVDTQPRGDRLYLVTNDGPTDSGSSNNRLVEYMVAPPIGGEDFAEGWWADEGPGPLKHQTALSTTRADFVCQPIGGLSGSDSQTSEPADFAGRATETATFSNNATPMPQDRATALAQLKNSVFFNGYTSVYGAGLRCANSSQFLLSCWINPSSDANGENIGESLSATAAQGLLLGGNPIYIGNWQATTVIPLVPPADKWLIGVSLVEFRGAKKGVGPITSVDGTVIVAPGQTFYFDFEHGLPAKFGTDAGAPVYRIGGIAPYAWASASGTPGDLASSPFELREIYSLGNGGSSGPADFGNPVDLSYDPASIFDDGWFHIMMAGKVIGPDGTNPELENTHFTIYINDTYVYDDVVAGDTLQMGTFSNANQACRTFPFGALANMCIGGEKYATSTTHDVAAPQGKGFVGGMSEFWFSDSQWLDISSSLNRAKFHITDLAGLTWAPKNLGAQGQTPTGTKPTIYCTGTPTTFPINRAKKKAPLAVYNDFPDVKHQVHNTFNPPVLDDWLGPVPGV